MYDQTEETLLKSQIKKFERTLQSQEQYIKYLYGIISGYESEIEELRQKNAELRIKLKNALEAVSLKEEGLQALERQLIEVDTLNIQLKARIKELAGRQQKNMAANPHNPHNLHNPIREILNHREVIAYSIADIRVCLDRDNIPVTPHIDNLFITANNSLDAIIRHADELQNIIEDKNNNEVRLEGCWMMHLTVKNILGKNLIIHVPLY